MFQDQGDAFSTIVYRGESDRPVAESTTRDGIEHRLYGSAEAPWNLMRRKSFAEVLRRYFNERKSSDFGIYWDTPDAAGRIAALADRPKQWRTQGRPDEP